MSSIPSPDGCCSLARRLPPETLAALDAALRDGTPYRKARERVGLASKFDTAVYKHRVHLLKLYDTAEASGEAPDAEQAQQLEAPGKQGDPVQASPALWIAAKPLLDETRSLRRRARKLLKRAEEPGEEGDLKAGAALIGQIRGLLYLEAQVLGLLKAPEPAPKQEPTDSGERRFVVEITEPIRSCPQQPPSTPESGDSSPPTGDPGTG